MVKKPKRSEQGRALMYFRDSGGKHEMTPQQYAKWGQREAKTRGLKFNGTPHEIKRMIRDRLTISGDMFLDYCVSGDSLSRSALDALREEIRRDLSVSHLLIPRRDRLARPGDATDGVRLEKELRLMGVTLVFMNMTLGPLRRGQRQELGETVSGVVDYHKSGEFLDEHAEKMIYAHIELTSQGFSSGGSPPWPFQRFLARSDGKGIRPLGKGEVVRLEGHHVVWLPSSEEKMKLLERILKMLKEMPASKVAKILMAEGIPSPGAEMELKRTDQGVLHPVSGVWHQTTITGLARNPFILHAMKTYGRRSMGNHRRMTPEGPRPLEDEEFVTDTKTKVVSNPKGSVVSSAAAGVFKPVISAQDAEELEKILNQRAGSQRGKPRSRDPSKNPLGGRIYDLNCTWPMYRVPYVKTFRYTCGLYQQSHGQACSHNHVDGPAATKLALAAISQRLLIPNLRQRLESQVRAALTERCNPDTSKTELAAKRAELKQVETQRATVTRNLALAPTPEIFHDISVIVEEFAAREAKLQHEIDILKNRVAVTDPAGELFEEAIRLADHLPTLAEDPDDLEMISGLFRAINLQMFVRFNAVQKAKRLENKQSGGVITWGNAPAPIEKYSGPTSRRALRPSLSDNDKSPKGNIPSGLGSDPNSGGKAESLGNVGRDDRI